MKTIVVYLSLLLFVNASDDKVIFKRSPEAGFDETFQEEFIPEVFEQAKDFHTDFTSLSPSDTINLPVEEEVLRKESEPVDEHITTFKNEGVTISGPIHRIATITSPVVATTPDQEEIERDIENVDGLPQPAIELIPPHVDAPLWWNIVTSPDQSVPVSGGVQSVPSNGILPVLVPAIDLTPPDAEAPSWWPFPSPTSQSGTEDDTGSLVDDEIHRLSAPLAPLPPPAIDLTPPAVDATVWWPTSAAVIRG